jgi:hypothetical protein
MQNSAGKFRVGILVSALFCVFFSFGEAFAAAGDLDFSFETQGRQVILNGSFDSTFGNNGICLSNNI